MTDQLEGGCQCGELRYRVQGEPSYVALCHCADCRKATGAPVSAFVAFMADAVTFSGQSPRTYSEGPVSRSFCATCGSPIAYVDARIGDQIFFLLGAMDAPELYKPTLHAYVREQLPFLHMPDGLPRHLKSSVPRPEDGTDQ